MAEPTALSQRVLLVEDEASLLVFYQKVLEEAGFHVRAARSGPEALAAFTEFSPDLVLLDLMLLGDMDGFDVLTALRARSPVRIIILTGQAGDARVVRGLNLGADNYLVKPISGAQLVARVRAQVRRTPGGNLSPDRSRRLFCYGDLVIDLGRSQMLRRGRRVVLGEVERRLLERLLQTPGRLVGYAELMEAGWGVIQPNIHREEIHQVLNMAYRLRRKLRQAEGREVLETVTSAGLVITAPDEVRD